MITINKQIVAQGSYGLRKINQRNGVDIGPVMTVWHVHDTARQSTAPGEYGYHRVGTFLTRREAEEAKRSYKGY